MTPAPAVIGRALRGGLVLALLLALGGRAAASAAAEEGMASWYGGKFHGRQTASGERYDKEKMTAAHRTLPFGTLVQVTNQANGSRCILRVTDRGPFAKGRILDCSERAARELGFWAAGTTKVRVEVLGRPGTAGERPGAPPSKKQRKRLERELERAQREGSAAPLEGLLLPVDDDQGPFELQVGAFRDPGNAERLAAKLKAEGHGARTLLTPEGFTRVRVGPYATRAEAEAAAPTLAVEETPFVVRKD